MEYLGTCNIESDTLKNLNNLKNDIQMNLATQLWFKKQVFFDTAIKEMIEKKLEDLQREETLILNEIKNKAKEAFPNGRKMAISYRLNEVKVYG